MLIQLPVETWIEILDWLRRRDLVKKLDSIWDREFTPIAQDWLHKYTRNVKLGKLWAEKDGLSVRSCGQCEKLPFADVDLPENVTGFERIYIRYLDSTLLAFLHRMSPLFHRNNNIHLISDFMNGYYETQLPIQTALGHLMPIFNNNNNGGSTIESLILDCELLQFLSANHPSILSNAKLIKIWNEFPSDASIRLCVEWLFTKRDDSGGDDHTRILVFHGLSTISGLCEKIRERFMDSARQHACCPFFVRIETTIGEQLSNIPDCENVRTGEQLTFKAVDQGDKWHYKLITNFPKNTELEWLDKKTAELVEWNMDKQQQVIELLALGLSPQLCAAEDAREMKIILE